MTLDLKQPIFYSLDQILQLQHREFFTGLMILPNFNISTTERLFGTTEDAILFAVLTVDTTLCEIAFFRIFFVLWLAMKWI